MLTAPIDGIVQQLVVHTIGEVVAPAQPLAVVVPRDRELEIETMVSNQDIGFVFAGQNAEIKVDAFNFTRATGRKPCEKDRNTRHGTSVQSDTAPFYRSRIAIERVGLRDVPAISMSRRACWLRLISRWARTPS